MQNCGLQEVKLDQNLFELIPSVLLQCASLSRLSMVSNRLTGLGTEELGCGRLTSLDLEKNLLSESSLPSLFRLVSLEELKLGHNFIKSIPPSISNLTRLHTLSLHHNPIDDVSVLSSLLSLRFLNLNDCRLDCVNSLSTLSNLRALALQHNHIFDFAPSMFSCMSQLQTLAVNDNTLVSLPPSIGNLVSLQRLFAHG